MKRFITAILLSAMLLTACGKDGASVETTVSETTAVITSEEVTTAETSKAAGEDVQIDEDIIPQDEMGQSMLDYVLADYIDKDTDPVLLTGERAERLEEAFRNIRINNSRFALPMMINALPEGFTAEYDYSSETKDKESCFNFYSGELLYDGEMCANIYIIRRDGADEEDGIIFGLVAMSSDCKWNFDAIEYSNDSEKIIECLGEPSCYTDMAEKLPIALYVSDIGSTVMFFEEVNSFIAVNCNFKNTLANVFFVESVPYDDFDNAIEIPELSGEPREFDFNMMFEDDCIIIGNDKYPVNVKLSDLSEDIKLFDYSTNKEYKENPDYIQDTYLFMYKGREVGLIGAIRKKDEEPEKADVVSWMFMSMSSYPFTASAMGVPLDKVLEVKDFYTGYEEEPAENGFYRYKGIAENEVDKFSCFIMMKDDLALINAIPYIADPERYDEFINSQ
ncbi:MAG: hypothetical protein IJ035_09410 [Oscillospiraceae bacterium]|nr:hypothetical protein [Oscillospiraceae bacterium]